MEDSIQDCELYYTTNCFTGEARFFMDTYSVEDFIRNKASKNGWSKSYAQILTKEKVFFESDDGGFKEYGS